MDAQSAVLAVSLLAIRRVAAKQDLQCPDIPVGWRRIAASAPARLTAPANLWGARELQHLPCGSAAPVARSAGFFKRVSRSMHRALFPSVASAAPVCVQTHAARPSLAAFRWALAVVQSRAVDAELPDVALLGPLADARSDARLLVPGCDMLNHAAAPSAR